MELTYAIWVQHPGIAAVSAGSEGLLVGPLRDGSGWRIWIVHCNLDTGSGPAAGFASTIGRGHNLRSHLVALGPETRSTRRRAVAASWRMTRQVDRRGAITRFGLQPPQGGVIDAYVVAPSRLFVEAFATAEKSTNVTDGRVPASSVPAAPAGAATLDAAALGAAFEREAPILLAAARAITLNDAEAQDLLQTTFELAIRHVASLRDPHALRPWLLAIQAREALRARRRLRRLVRLDQGPVAIPAGAAAAADSLAIRDALRRLSPRVRAAVVLHHMAGLSVREVAVALGTSENTVKSQLKTGLARLREELRDD